MEPTSSYCDQCGSMVRPGANFCQGCGSRISLLPDVKNQIPSDPFQYPDAPNQSETSFNKNALSTTEVAQTDSASQNTSQSAARIETANNTDEIRIDEIFPKPQVQETQTDRTVRAFSATKFALCALLFLMPFVNVSCSGMVSVKLTGTELSFGKTLQIREPFTGKVRKHQIKPEPLALMAFAAAICGVSVCLAMRNRRVSIVNAALGGFGILFLLLLKSKLDSDVLREGEGMLSISYDFGYWAVVTLFLAISLLNGFRVLSAPATSSAERLQ